MADDLSSIATLRSVLAETAHYDNPADVDLAKRRRAALRQVLVNASQSSQQGRSMAFDMRVIENDLARVEWWIRENDTPSEADRLRTTDCVLADWTAFRGGAT